MVAQSLDSRLRVPWLYSSVAVSKFGQFYSHVSGLNEWMDVEIGGWGQSVFV